MRTSEIPHLEKGLILEEGLEFHSLYSVNWLQLQRNLTYLAALPRIATEACAPIELKILSSLRILGRGWVMDDVTELTGMSNETIRVSFHNFNKAFVSKYYEEYVHIP